MNGRIQETFEDQESRRALSMFGRSCKSRWRVVHGLYSEIAHQAVPDSSLDKLEQS